MRLDKPLIPISTPNATPEWRSRDRLKTVSAALVVCLRIGYDPPDVVQNRPLRKIGMLD